MFHDVSQSFTGLWDSRKTLSQWVFVLKKLNLSSTILPSYLSFVFVDGNLNRNTDQLTWHTNGKYGS